MFHEKIYELSMAEAESAATALVKAGKDSKWGNTYNITQWIHLAEGVNIGVISPMEAYDAFELGYVPMNLTVRKTRYSHLL